MGGHARALTSVERRAIIATRAGEGVLWASPRKRVAEMFARITVNPKQMGGAPCIRALRIPIATVVGMVADGMTDAEILHAYPDLEPADIREALHYAVEAVSLPEHEDAGWSVFSLRQAMRGMEDEPSPYSADGLKEGSS